MERTWAEMWDLLSDSLIETFYMVFFSTIFSSIFGIVLGVIIVITSKSGLTPNFIINKILDVTVNILRSFPFIILIIVLFPLSRFIVGTTIGPSAVIVPLSILATPLVARLVSNALFEVDKALVEASLVMGASYSKIVFGVLIAESLPSLIDAITVTIINIIGASAMAGAIGGGGIGDLAIRYGYQRFETDVLIVSVIAIVIIVQAIQITGDFLSNSIRKKRGLLFTSNE